MGRFKGRTIDRNRFGKKYPFVRAPYRPSIMGDNEIVMELGKLLFNNEQSKVFKFETSFPNSEYNIMLVARDPGTGESANVNLYVDNASSDRSKITVVASAPFTGEVDVVAVKVG